ncbi:4Fe-4S dicluster domain-containing protein [Chloroflexota bacterium]
MKKVYVKEEVCIGCHLCEVYCQLQHAEHEDLIKAFKRESPRPIPRLRVEEKGEVSFSIRCQQCDEAPCVQACLTGALSRDPVTSLVKTDEERCIGCWTCILVCPFAAIGRDIKNKKSVRCDLCQGEEVPVCVSNCPNEALVYLEVADENLSLKNEMVDSIQ